MVHNAADRNVRKTDVGFSVHKESHGNLANRMDKVALVALPYESFKAEHVRAQQSISSPLFALVNIVSPR